MRVLAAARVPRQATTGGSSNNSVSTRYCGLHAKLARARPNRNIAEIRGVCKKPAAGIISEALDFQEYQRPSGRLIADWKPAFRTGDSSKPTCGAALLAARSSRG